jgi:hypothetical protein
MRRLTTALLIGAAVTLLGASVPAMAQDAVTPPPAGAVGADAPAPDATTPAPAKHHRRRQSHHRQHHKKAAAQPDAGSAPAAPTGTDAAPAAPAQ